MEENNSLKNRANYQKSMVSRSKTHDMALGPFAAFCFHGRSYFGRLMTFEVDVMFPIGVVVLTVALAPLSVTLSILYGTA